MRKHNVDLTPADPRLLRARAAPPARAPALRLVAVEDAAPDRAPGRPRAHPGAESTPAAEERTARRIARENMRSSGLSPDDARLIMAMRVSEALEGGTAAILPPQRRSRLMQVARTLGLRPFDASLVIAIVQDAARRGESPDRDETSHSIRMVSGAKTPKQAPASWTFVLALALAIVLGGGAGLVLILWIRGV